MLERFIWKGFRPDSLAIIEQANRICADYQGQGYNISLRQLYYQFVSKDLIPNSERSYKRLGSIINDARLAGLLDWSYMEDRGRNVQGGFWGFQTPGSYLSQVADSYYENIWKGQDWRPEVWVEKEALVDVVSRACGPTRTPYFACKGYVSQSEMYDAAKRIQTRVRQGHTPLVIHLGDHDPSGIDMTRDIQDRLELMSEGRVEVRRIALNMDQIEQYGPPPNPAKLTDSRGADYVDRYGDESWELDALEPTVLVDLIQNELAGIIDQDEMDRRLAHEREGEERLQVVIDRWDDLETHWDDVLDVIDR